MSIVDGVRHVLWSLMHRRTADAETREELAYHLARQAEKHVAAGASPADARRAALLELGGAERWREETAEARWGSVVDDVIADARYAIRGLIARPGFALSALSTLAIGLGAATAIFSVVDGALFRPLPFSTAGDVMAISLRMPIAESSRVVDMTWSYPKFSFFRDRQRAFPALALHSPEAIVVGGSDGAERISGEMASAAYFDVLGIRPIVGRTYSEQEDRIGGNSRVVVLGHDFWMNRFAADPRAVGRELTIGGWKHSIVGVMPPGFRGLSGDARLWIPVPAARSAATLQAAAAHNMHLVGRLRPDASRAAAEAEVAELGREIDAAFPNSGGSWGAAAYSLSDLRVHPVMRRTLQLLSAAVALLLSIVCVNLIILQVTRGTARQQELAVRMALGGSRGRLVQQLATESVIVAVIGGLGALVVGAFAVRFLSTTLPVSMPDVVGSRADLTRLTFSRIYLDGRGLAFASLLTLAVGLAIGVSSALRTARMGSVAALRQGSASGAAGGGRFVASSSLVVVQVALALVFLIGSGLTIQSLRRTLSIPLGYDPTGLLTVSVTLDPVRAATESTTVLWRNIRDEVRALPGVRTVAVGTCSPIGMHCDGTGITPVGRSQPSRARFLMASSEYFAALRTGLIRGRVFERADESPSRPVMIINQTAARTIWGSDDPLVTPVQSGDRLIHVIGIVDDARYGDIERPAEPAIFVPYRGGRGVLFIRADADAARLAAPIRQAIRRAGAGHALGQIQLMSTSVRDATIRNRLSAQIFAGFAASALALAAIGIYGALALQVSQRARELAIRRALGASSASLFGMIGRHAARIAVAGSILGTFLAMALNRMLAPLLYDANAMEPMIFATSVAILIAATAFAAGIPTLRSLRVDPREAMRAE